jgi:GNAT superfamily N-acetyltransferase
MHHDPVAIRNWGRLAQDFPGFQVALFGERDGVVAAGYSAPLYWDGTTEGLPEGWDAAFEQALADLASDREPTATSALLATVDPAYQGRGLSAPVLEALKAVARKAGMGTMSAPVRPTMKALYPLAPIEDYVRWRNDRGEVFDPWLRVHEKLGAKLLQVAPSSMVISGSVAQWEGWTGMAFPRSGRYVVPGALCPVEVDRKRDLIRYVEPNVWMVHQLAGDQS